ncbi:hypothetical protein LJC00_00735 [Dysgonomonas sp. OttesenSCG-928-M03]|nr:hypothetical protein [Dysgonomonas sp. OttesenSCG-928-M03]
MLLDITAREVLNKLSNKEVLHTIIESDGSYTFSDFLDIDTKEIKSVENIESNNLKSTSATPLVLVELFEHDLRGRKLPLILQGVGRVGYPDLRKTPYGNFDDILSSVNLNNLASNRPARVTLYRHLDYTGSSISFDAPAKEGNLVQNLRPYKIGGFLGIGGTSWTDQATSVSLSNL